jgi:hypothetical protein
MLLHGWPLQTTDKKVNEVTPALFALAPDAASMAQQEVGGWVGAPQDGGGGWGATAARSPSHVQSLPTT